MGAYLSTPVRDKESKDYDGDFLSFGASSMQGWRMTQEDAHNCQVDFDKEKNTSLFAVYDGHGGAEVAQYSSMNLPKFLKRIAQYEKGHIDEALEEAFLGFDATLTEDTVIQQLKDLAGLEKDSSEVDEEVKNEAAALCEEASMPLEKVLERYRGIPAAGGLVNKGVYSLRKRQKFQSPLVKTKGVTHGTGADATSEEVSSSEQELTSSNSEDLDDVKLRLEDKLTNGFSVKNDAVGHVADNSSENLKSKVATSNKESILSCKGQNMEPDSDVEMCNWKRSAAEMIDTVNSGNQLNQSGSRSIELPDDNQCQQSSKEDAYCSSSSLSSTELAGPSNSNSSSTDGTNAAVGKEENKEEEETEEEEVDSDDDEDMWNSADAEDDSDEDDADGFEVDDEDDDDEDDEDDEDNDEEGTMHGWSDEPGADSGCTAVVALLRGRKLYVANAGDSRCVLCRNGKAVEMSNDHKPEDLPEQHRIVKAGGRVTSDGRVNGGLNLSRALGDHSYKKNTSLSAREQMITALPDVKSIMLTDEDKFMVLACDGIWNVMSSQDVVDFVQRRLDDGLTKLSAICEEMFDFCLAPDTTGDGTGCDNMTCVIVKFNKLHNTDVEVSKKRQADDDSESEVCLAYKRVRQTDEDSKNL